MRKIYIGCSGYYYPEWKGNFYPENISAQEWFKFYTKKFNSVEINSTFYSFPKSSSLKRLYKISPEDFLFSTKVNRLITHIKKLKNVEEEINKFYVTLKESLKEKLGCLLFQLPSSFAYTEGNLQKIIHVRNLINVCIVFEFRNKTWWNKRVFSLFKEKDIIFCSVKAPGLPDSIVNINKKEYLRIHGKNRWYKDELSYEEILRIKENLEKEKAEKLYIYFNNTYNGFAPKNASLLKSMLEENKETSKN